MHIQTFHAFFGSLAHNSVLLVPFSILRVVPYSSKGFTICTLNSAQFLASIICSACMRCNGTKGTATFTTEEVHNGRAVFAVTIQNKEAILWPQPRQRKCKTAAGQQWKTTAPNAGLGVGQCLSKGDSTRLTDAHRYVRERFRGP